MRLLVDTDLGTDVDDALALLLLLGQPAVELVGVTTVYGPTRLRARIARRILEAAGRQVPVVAGAGRPLGSPMPIWLTGTEGVGMLDEAPAAAPGLDDSEGAERLIIEQAHAAPDEVTLLCLGPLTNLARALELDPALPGLLREVVFMGGGVTLPHPPPPRLEVGREFRSEPSHNVRCDVRAAQRVLDAGFARLRLVTNDVTEQLWWTGSSLRGLLEQPANEAARIVGELLRVWLGHLSQAAGEAVQGTLPHDPLAAAEAAGQHFCRFARGRMSVDERGAGVFVPSGDGPHEVAFAVEGAAFVAWFSERMGVWS